MTGAGLSKGDPVVTAMAEERGPSGVDKDAVLSLGRISALKAEEDNVSARANEVSEKAHKLLKRAKNLRLKRKAAAKKVGREADNYAQITCRALSDRMLFKLPVEIREMIYGHLFPGVQTRSGPRPRTCPCHSKVQSIKPAHYYLPSYVGPELAREISEAHWRNTAITVVPEGLVFLTDADCDGMGVTPAKHIRKLTVELYDTVIGKARAQKISPTESLRQDFAPLFDIERKDICKLRFLIEIDSYEDLAEVLEALHSILPSLDDADFKVEVDHIHGLFTYGPISLNNLTEMMHMSEDQFDEWMDDYIEPFMDFHPHPLDIDSDGFDDYDEDYVDEMMADHLF